MTTMAYQITSLTVVYSIVYSSADQRKHQSSASLALCGEFTVPLLQWKFRSSPFEPMMHMINTLRQRQNGRHFADIIFKWILLNENWWILIKISLRFVPRGPIDDILALVQRMAWHRLGNKPLSEPMMVILMMHICITWPQWVNYVLLKTAGCDYLSIQ